MKNFRDSLKEKLKDPEFKKEWDALEPEFRAIRQQLDAEARDNVSVKRERESRHEQNVAIGYAM